MPNIVLVAPFLDPLAVGLVSMTRSIELNPGTGPAAANPFRDSSIISDSSSGTDVQDIPDEKDLERVICLVVPPPPSVNTESSGCRKDGLALRPDSGELGGPKLVFPWISVSPAAIPEEGEIGGRGGSLEFFFRTERRKEIRREDFGFGCAVRGVLSFQSLCIAA